MRQINLLPKNLQKAIQIKKVRNSALIIFIPVFTFVLIGHFGVGFWVDSLRRSAEAPPSMNETPEIVRLRQGIKSVNAETKNFAEHNEGALEILKQDYPVSKIIKALGDASDKKAWIKGLTFDSEGGVCRIDGASLSTKTVSEFMLELKKISFFKNVELINMGKQKSGGLDKIDFQLSCGLK